MKDNEYAYVCPNKKCRMKGEVQYYAMSPSGYKFATGSPVTCTHCSSVVTYRPWLDRIVERDEDGNVQASRPLHDSGL